MDLYPYQEKFLASLDTSETNRNDWLPTICGFSKSYLERLLEKWTSLRQFEERILEEERKLEAQKRETLQPTVESESDDDVHQNLPRSRRSTAELESPKPCRPGSIQPLFTEASTLPIPVPDSKFGPTAPLSPASSYGVSPRSSITSLPVPNQNGYSPVSPRSSISSLPIEITVAIHTKEKDDEIDLEIPWRICTRKSYWRYLDGKLVESNAEPSALNQTGDRSSWTEIQASWVCKEALEEAKYEFSQFQKLQEDDRKTTLEACFRIEKALTFKEVKELVERTVQIYRETQPPTPQPRKTRPSFPQPAVDGPVQPAENRDEDRTPLAKQYQHPPLERTTSSYVYPRPPRPQPPLPHHPPLDRSTSLPGGAIPTYPARPRPTQLHLPIMPPPYVPQPGQVPFSPPAALFSPHALAYSPQALPAPQFSPTFNSPHFDRRRSSNNNLPLSPLRQSQSQSHYQQPPDHYSSPSTTSDSEDTTRPRERVHRSRSRRPSGGKSKKKHHSTVGTLAKVGGLAALLDGIVDLGVL